MANVSARKRWRGFKRSSNNLVISQTRPLAFSRASRQKPSGLVVPSIADSFFSIVAEAVQEIARAHDSLLIVTVSNNDPAIELENLNVLIRHRTDGLLIAPAHSENRSLANMLDKLSIPSVTFDRPLYESAVPSVVSNNYKGAKAATQHLIMHGCKRILCLGGEIDLYTIKERIRGYKEAVKQAGLEAIGRYLGDGLQVSRRRRLRATSIPRTLRTQCSP